MVITAQMLLGELQRRTTVAKDPIVVQLLRIFNWGAVAIDGGYVDRAVIARGRPYTGVTRPAEDWKGRDKECFINAERL